MLTIKIIERTVDSIMIERRHFHHLARYTAYRRLSNGKIISTYITPEKAEQLMIEWNMKKVDEDFSPAYSREYYR